MRWYGPKRGITVRSRAVPGLLIPAVLTKDAERTFNLSESAIRHH
jgi:hypothetical protein